MGFAFSASVVSSGGLLCYWDCVHFVEVLGCVALGLSLSEDFGLLRMVLKILFMSMFLMSCQTELSFSTLSFRLLIVGVVGIMLSLVTLICFFMVIRGGG